MTYHHLTQEERYQIYAFRKADFTIRAIADELGRSPSTISRELQRNVNRRGYRPKMAHRLARQRAQCTRRSITLDNGTEFACHPRMARSLSSDIYFAEPYKPWQRGSNENTNGLIRQYLPKKMKLDNLTQKELDAIERRLNHRPRKCLGYLTPHEVFNNTRDLLTVALRS